MTVNSLPLLTPLQHALTLPEAVDFQMVHNSGEVAFAYSADGEDPGAPPTLVTHLEFGRACHRAAHLLRPINGSMEGAKRREVVAIVALLDTLVYQTVTVGAMIAGLVPFPISPRNSPAAIARLLSQTGCRRLLVTQGTLARLVEDVKMELGSDYELTVQEVPGLGEVYPCLHLESGKIEPEFERYPHDEEPATRPLLTDVAMYQHSSGSTGFPKPVPQTHRGLMEWGAMAFPNLWEHPRLRIAAMALPPFHTMAFIVQVLYPLYGVIAVALFPPVVVKVGQQPYLPASETILEHARRSKANALIIIPALLQGMINARGGLQFLKQCVFVAYGGGPISKKIGDSLAASGVNLQPVYGATETGTTTTLRLNRGQEADWEWMEFNDRATIHWEPQDDGTFEAQYMVSKTHHPSVLNMNSPRGYATSDMFLKHPTKNNMWRIVGRIDDVIIHSSGEKTVPAPMEGVMLSSTLIQGAVMFGREHDQAGVLLEPTIEHSIDVNDHAQLAALRNKLWPIIEEANNNAPAFSRVYKEMILIASKNKPLPRTGKGTVMRKAALHAYEREIQDLYRTIESNAGGEEVVPPLSWNADGVKSWLLQQAKEIQSGREVSASKDLFEQGFDSLSATFLRLRIVGALRRDNGTSKSTAATIPQNAIYTYPTIEKLSRFIADFVTDPDGSTKTGDRAIAIEDMIVKYTAGWEATLTHPPTNGRANPPRVVLITGSTGYLGSEILALLLQDTSVERIYALNRASSDSQTMIDRHEGKFVDKELDPCLLRSEKLFLLEGDASQELLGQTPSVYDEMRKSVTMIIHVAWRMDFNLTLASFEPNVKAARNLIDFARTGAHPSSLRFVNISSISSSQSWDPAKGPYPEEIIHDAAVAVGGGYGEAKYVIERILAKSDLHATSVRSGQISGGRRNGAWATSDWLPIIIKSSLTLGAMPTAAGVASWVPMDATARVILDVAFSSIPPPPALNLVHPNPVSWNSVIASIQASLAKQRVRGAERLNQITLQEWVSCVENYSKNITEEDLKKMPAIKLLHFYRTMAHADLKIMRDGRFGAEVGGIGNLATEKMQQISRTLRELSPLDLLDSDHWTKYWADVGFFN